MKYIITGATGHIGNNLVRLLLSKGIDVKILVRNLKDKAIESLDCEKVVGDITDINFLESVIEENSIVIHSAGLIDVTNKLVDDLMNVNVWATIDLVQVCIKKKVWKFIYISSTDALNGTGILKEPIEFSLDGMDSYYGISKAMASDYVLKAINMGLINGCILCPSCVIGVNDYKISSQGGVIKKQIKKKIALSTKGHYNFIDVDNLVEAIYNASIVDAKPIYLLTGVDVNVSSLFKAIFKVLNKKGVIIHIPLFLVKFGLLFMPIYYKITKEKPIFTKFTIKTINEKKTFDSSLAKNDLGLKDTNFEKVIEKTINWFLKNE
ncbi:MAG: NAD-dependent epimerase/dehydratase family protein [Bacilli bacterium]|nr:NAD-dependent epimerase/dehydratase family protein [Bacilli bacterium]